MNIKYSIESIAQLKINVKKFQYIKAIDGFDGVWWKLEHREEFVDCFFS